MALVGFAVTGTFLTVLGMQFWLAGKPGVVPAPPAEGAHGTAAAG